VLGRLADTFRLYWGLLYWNIRKSWFQLRRGRSACPCQSPSDSGRAFETRCDACLLWQKPALFRRVCPLLVETKDGLRCSVDTADVRPFWGRAFGYYGGTLGALYLTGVVIVFSFFRSVGYPVSVAEVALPHLWPRLTYARAWLFFERSQKAFSAGDTQAGLAYLDNAYEFDPHNYAIGLTLAKNYQVGRPGRSDEIFVQLMRDHPKLRDATAWDWHLALLARGNFEKIATLASDELLSDPAHAQVWLRALLFATQRSGDNKPLQTLLADNAPAAALWHHLLEVELRLRQSQTREARATLDRPWAADAPPFTVYYRAETLIKLGDSLAALNLLDLHRRVIDDEARSTLRLEAFARANLAQSLRTEADQLLAPGFSLPIAKVLCAHLIRYPDRNLFERLCNQAEQANVSLTSDTAGVWFSLLCAAGAVGDTERLHTLTTRLRQGASTPFIALTVVEAFFQGKTAERRITSILPILPLPLEVTYALIERFGNPTSPAKPAPR
jgi:hypothetical protein